MDEIFSPGGDFYKIVGHHGPAIENEYMGLRLYFNHSGSIDVYSKRRFQLELEKTDWYPDSLMQINGYGSDQYKVGPTVGLGGIKLWDGEKIVKLHATKGRMASVRTKSCTSTMEMMAKAVPYRGDSVDVLIRVTIYAQDRFAEVEAIALSDREVQFVTGVNYHSGCKTYFNDDYAIVWGKHPEDVAINPGEIGAAIVLDSNHFEKKMKTDSEILYIFKPGKRIRSFITSVSENEDEINDYEKLKNLVESFSK